MAITLGSLIRIIMVQNVLGQETLNLWDYEVDGSAFLVEPVQIAEAWWNHVKTTYRAIPPTIYTDMFRSVRIVELNNAAGDYAEYAVPIGERAGTRTAATEGTKLAPYQSIGVRLTVGTRLTRPGQKRLAGLIEFDNQDGVLLGPALTPANAHMAVMTEPMILGAPAATIVLNPVVAGADVGGEYDRIQPVLGWVINPYITTQNSRKYGRGS